MRADLRVETLEGRRTPAAVTLADIAGDFAPGAFAGVMPDVPRGNVIVGAADLNGPGVAGGMVDIFAAHGAGDSCRVVVRDADAGLITADFFAFDPAFAGGVRTMTAVGGTLYVAPGDGAGPVVAAVDLATGTVSHFLAPGVDPRDRRGVADIRAADIDADPRADSPDPAAELVILVGPVVTYAEPDGTPRLSPVFAAPPADPRPREFVPAGVGVVVPGLGAVGFATQPAGDPSGTASFAWGGTPSPTNGSGDWFDFAPLVV